MDDSNLNHDLYEVKNFIAGQKTRSQNSNYLPIYNPALGKAVGKVYLAKGAEVNQAVKAAKEAFETWHDLSTTKKSALFFSYLKLLEADIDQFANLVSKEHGKTIEDAKGSIARGLEVVEFCCGISTHLKSEFSANVASNLDVYNLRQPLGVCAGVVPFNFPAMVPMWMYPIAIACGNTFVLKASEKVPSSAVYQAEKFKQAGFPDGVLNVIIGDKEAVDAILEHKDVAAVSFVGSTNVGEYIYHKATAHNKRVQALCGAKNHLVVLPDADIEQATDALISSAYGSAGERCMAISVAVTVGDDTSQKVVDSLIPKIKKLKIGPYTQKEVEMGPIISAESCKRINYFIEEGIKEGAKLLVDGRDYKVKGYEDGFFMGGSLFDEVKENMKIYQEEIFGPVLCIVRVDSYAEALDLVNNHKYGNGVALFTKNGNYARHFTMNAKIGMVGINVAIPVPVSFHSFGGWKSSIFGANSIYGMEGVRFYTRLKTVTNRWSDKFKETSFNFTKSSEH